MVDLGLKDYVSVRKASELINRSIYTLYAYLRAGVIEDAVHLGRTRWLVPKQWIDDFLAGKVNAQGAYKGIYAQYRKKRKRD